VKKLFYKTLKNREKPIKNAFFTGRGKSFYSKTLVMRLGQDQVVLGKVR